MSKRRLFCWSGGGLPGLDIHVGIWKALSEIGIESTANAGTSAGAIVAAINSTGVSNAVANSIILDLTDDDIRRERFLWKLRIPWINSFLDPKPILDLLTEILPAEFSDLKKKLSVFVTEEVTASQKEIKTDGQLFKLPQTVLASMSIMGVFPTINGYSDGGTTAYLPLPDDWSSYDEIYLLIAKRPLDYRKQNGILTRSLFNADILYEDQVADTIVFARRNHPAVTVIRPSVKTPEGSLHFNHDLIRQAYEYTRAFMSTGKALS